jgi:iron complex outermembrane receptor protein
VSASFGCLLLAAQAGAQQTSAQPQASDADEGKLSEIVVTAERRSERLQDVPLEVAVMTNTDAAKMGAVDTMTMDTQIPTLQASHQTSGTTIFLRGVGTIASPGIENAVANYVDDVYVNGFSGGIIQFNNIDRIEVLEGPQGTLFGRNATGGVLHIVTKDPSSTPALNVQVGYGNYDTYSSSVYGTAGITDNLAADIAFESRDQRNGWGYDLTTGQQINLGEEYAVRTKWKWTPTAKTSVTVAIDHYYDDYDYGIDETVVPGTLSAGGATFAGVFNTQGNNPYSHTPDGPGRSGHALHVDGQSLTIDHDFGWADLKSISARRYTSDYVAYDQDAGPGHYNDARWPYSLMQYSEELHLTSPESAELFGRKWHWLAGLYYMNTRDYLSLNTSGAVDGTGLLYIGTGISYTRSYSGFVDSTLEVLPDTNLTLGFRETADRIGNESNSYFLAAPGLAFTTVYPEAGADATRGTWRAVIDHKFLPDLMVYASASSGFKSGGFNLFAPGSAPVRPESIQAYALGVKSDLFDRKLQLNIEGYDYDYKDQQVEVIEGGAAFDVNAAASRIYGIDLKTVATPIRDLSIFANLGYLHGRYGSFPGAPIYLQSPASCAPMPHRLPGPLVPGSTQCSFDAAGLPTIRSPSWSGNVGFDYKWRLGGVGSLDFNANYYYTSSFDWDPSGQYPEPPFGLMSSSLIWSSPSAKYDTQVWCSNCFNKYHNTFIAESGPAQQMAPAEPRYYGIKVGAHF